MRASAPPATAGPKWRAARLAVLAAAWISIWACAETPTREATAAGPAAAMSEVDRSARRAEARLPNGKSIALEIADTPDLRGRGYMFRKSVGAGEGMIFVFDEPGPQSMWMKNTLVPLDMLWLDDEFHIVHLAAPVPPCKADPCPPYASMRKARYVLELQGGAAAREGLKVGDRVPIAFPQSAD
jgi:uncharacterized protein